ncbi:amidohydrolase family protein [Hyphococcus flavus]|uniref:Amidohydrolase family protein n=1 Tax=Hyphococcus flavus TaxID=1866326 RepID=A0AAF0CFK4_9PROT|nr:amidohydrolase family protein [Hyphococcus flavus]WDI32546.1 amidohydrolase family protein [Hyphococcus flavus]
MKRKIFSAIVAVSGLALTACASADFKHDAVLYHGFSHINPEEERIVPNAWMVVSGEKIVNVGSGSPPAGNFAERRDLSGLYAMPGLIDAHGHIAAGAHKIELIDGAPAVTIESVDEMTRFHAQNALAFGVTTVRNPGSDPQANARYDENVANGTWIGPEALHAGAIIQPPPFTGGAFAYPRTDEEWDREAARQAALGMTHFKLYVSLSEEELAKGIKAAHKHGLKAIAHLDGVSWTSAARLGIDGLEHALPTSPDLLEPGAREEYLASLGPDSKFMYRWFELADFDGPLFQELLALLVDNQVEINLTLGVNELTFNVDKVDQIWPPEDRRYIHAEALAGSLSFMQAGAAAWTPEDYDRARAAWPKVQEFAKRLYDAGVPMMIGTDGFGGGPQLAHEMELHVDAGIPVWAVLRMATSDAAELLGMGDRTGAIAANMEADVVFLRANPVENVLNISSAAYVLSNGVGYAFDELARTNDQPQ